MKFHKGSPAPTHSFLPGARHIACNLHVYMVITSAVSTLLKSCLSATHEVVNILYRVGEMNRNKFHCVSVLKQ